MVIDRLRNRFYLPRVAWVLALSATIWNIGGSMSNPYQSIFFSAVGANYLFIGYLLALSSAVTAIMQLIGGFVADAWGRRRVIIIFSFVSAGSAFLFIFISQSTLLLIPVILSSIAGIYGPAFNATLTDSMPAAERPRGMVVYTLITSLPSVFAPYVGGFLMSTYGQVTGLRIAFFLSGLFGVIGVSYRGLTLKETFIGSNVKQSKNLASLINDFFHYTYFALKNASNGAKKLLVYSVLASAGTGMTAPYSSLYLVKSLGLAPEFYGVLTNLAGLISVLLLLPAARIFSRFGLRRSAIYASISVPVNQLIFVRAKGRDDLVTWTVVGGVSGALLAPSLTTLQADLSSQEMRGRIMGLFSVLSLIVAIPAQVAGGYLYQNVGALMPFIVSIPVFAGATLMLTQIKEPKTSEES